MEGQNWNNTLEYIKLFLGVPINLLEISDDELVGYLKRQVVPLFSQYAPLKKFTYITAANQISPVSGSPSYMYRIPVESGEYIVDILEAYPLRDVSIVDVYGGALINAQMTMDMVIASSYIDAVRSLQVRNTWEFIPPDILVFEQEITACAVIYNTPHVNLDTIRPDLYHKAFKPLCLGYTKLWIASMRSKFEALATPFGQINLNYDRLQTEGQQAIDNAISILETIPPDILIEVS
ncbi:MAG TPA: hypothetical protein PLL26_05345 [Candidatus Dojkabacteria bacterium]|nr:hypothetical protein [Candidatus Dojkabacteria bacterium]